MANEPDPSADDPDAPPDAEAASPAFRRAVENLFPYPIAQSFILLRGIDDPLAEIPQLANLLGVTLQHLAMLAVAEYLADTERDKQLDVLLADRFHKPLSHGQWVQVLHRADILEATAPGVHGWARRALLCPAGTRPGRSARCAR